MATPFTRSAEAELRARLGLEQLQRDREERRLQAIERLGGQVVGGLQQGFQQSLGAVDRYQQRQAEAEALAKKLGVQSAIANQKAGLKAADLGAKELQERLKRLPTAAQGVVAQTGDPTLQAMSAAEGPIRPEDAAEAMRKRLTAGGFQTQGIDDATIQGVFDQVALQRRGKEADVTKKETDLISAAKAAPLTEQQRSTLVKSGLTLEGLPKLRTTASGLSEDDWEKIGSYLKYAIEKGLPVSPALSLGGNVDISVQAMVAGAGAGMGAQTSQGVKDVGQEMEVELRRKIAELSPEAQDFLAQVDAFNRKRAKREEPRLTDADWVWWEKNGLFPFAGREVFKQRYNSMAESAYRDYQLELQTMLENGAAVGPTLSGILKNNKLDYIRFEDDELMAESGQRDLPEATESVLNREQQDFQDMEGRLRRVQSSQMGAAEATTKRLAKEAATAPQSAADASTTRERQVTAAAADAQRLAGQLEAAKKAGNTAEVERLQGELNGVFMGIGGARWFEQLPPNVQKLPQVEQLRRIQAMTPRGSKL